ncbi:permease [Schnuerera sp. xch1]|uniref:permease n=1 Tax=Schnuerera sp. xch1 TaxID=2874283 RepID=UPI001CBBFEB0|nr:permease [Schnuerera sp. xch1]MBZ2175823.1 permease [Schnuerera sp. xch1]
MKLIKRYSFFIGTLILTLLIILINREVGMKAVDTIAYSFKEMLVIIPPIFILLGLLDVWVPKKTMTKYMGEDSGLIGILLSFLLGSAAAGPLYGAFPVAAVFMKKGVKFSNVLIFIGAWSTTKIPLFLFESTFLGFEFALTRLAINIPGILLIVHIISGMINEEERINIYKTASDL